MLVNDHRHVWDTHLCIFYDKPAIVIDDMFTIFSSQFESVLITYEI